MTIVLKSIWRISSLLLIIIIWNTKLIKEIKRLYINITLTKRMITSTYINDNVSTKFRRYCQRGNVHKGVVLAHFAITLNLQTYSRANCLWKSNLLVRRANLLFNARIQTLHSAKVGVLCFMSFPRQIERLQNNYFSGTRYRRF